MWQANEEDLQVAADDVAGFRLATRKCRSGRRIIISNPAQTEEGDKASSRKLASVRAPHKGKGKRSRKRSSFVPDHLKASFGRVWALSRFKVDEFVPRTQHVNLRIVCRPEAELDSHPDEYSS